MSKRLRDDLHLNQSGCNKLDHEWYRLISKTMEPHEIITVGVDEVGNGAVYGPIAVAAVTIFTGWRIDGVKDSKQVKNEKTRRVLASEIRHNTVWTIGMLPAKAIDNHGDGPALEFLQLEVIKAQVARIRKAFPQNPIEVWLDGDGEVTEDANFKMVRLAKADSLVYEVSAASLLAKVCVDDWINDQVKKNALLARYKLESNKGYGTHHHITALKEHGLTEHHRRDTCVRMMEKK